MSHEITLEQAVECAQQTEIVCRLIQNYPGSIDDCDVSALASLLKRLSGEVSLWLGEELARKGAV